MHRNGLEQFILIIEFPLELPLFQRFGQEYSRCLPRRRGKIVCRILILNTTYIRLDSADDQAQIDAIYPMPTAHTKQSSQSNQIRSDPIRTDHIGLTNKQLDIRAASSTVVANLRCIVVGTLQFVDLFSPLFVSTATEVNTNNGHCLVGSITMAQSRAGERESYMKSQFCLTFLLTKRLVTHSTLV